MAAHVMTKIRVLTTAAGLLACAAGLSACDRGPQGNAAGDLSQAPLAGARIGGPFTLVDQDGKTVRWSDFEGKYRLVYFGYTYCPDVCPVDMQEIMGGYRQFAKAHPDRAAKVQPIFITVDPERDTQAVVRNWVSAFGRPLIGLTGSPDEIAKVKKAFAVVASREGKDGPGDYLVAHSRTPYLFGPQGDPIALVPVNEPGTGQNEGSHQAIAQFLDQWVT